MAKVFFCFLPTFSQGQTFSVFNLRTWMLLCRELGQCPFLQVLRYQRCLLISSKIFPSRSILSKRICIITKPYEVSQNVEHSQLFLKNRSIY